MVGVDVGLLVAAVLLIAYLRPHDGDDDGTPPAGGARQ